LAVIKGVPKKRQGTICEPIGRHPRIRKKMAVVTPPHTHGRDAITHVTLLKRLHPFSLIACRLETGRTHQIRVHMAHLGHPILGDPLYARPFNPPNNWPEAARTAVSGFNHQALHAAELAFEHPVNEQKMHFKTAPPEDFLALLEALQELGAVLNV